MGIVITSSINDFYKNLIISYFINIFTNINNQNFINFIDKDFIKIIGYILFFFIDLKELHKPS